ncbi:MAG: putative Ig domain-containing protein [Blastocatellia bacterium]
MNNKGFTHGTTAQRACLLACLLAMSLLAIGVARRAGRTAVAGETTLNGAAAIEKLKNDGTYDSLNAAVQATRYAAQPLAGGGWETSNPAQQINATYDEGAIRLRPAHAKDDTAPAWRAGLKLTGYGAGGAMSTVDAGAVSANGSRVEIRRAIGNDPRAVITEWYVNKPEGIEQGFTLGAPPASASGRAPSGVRLILEVTGDLRAQAGHGEQGLTLVDAEGRVALGYDRLAAWDATGKSLPAAMSVHDGEIALDIDTADAAWPVTVDPYIYQLTKLLASDGAAQDYFGSAVAISGDVAMIGAPGDDTDHGSVYLYTRNGATWTQTKLTAADGAAQDNFGWSVAIDGNTAVVGAPGDNNSRGSLYVYEKSGGVWGQTQRLEAGDGLANDKFGVSVSLAGTTIAGGAYQHDWAAGANQGAVYLFTRNGATWTQKQKLTAVDAAAGDEFGWRVSLNDAKAAIGAPGASGNGAADAGAVYVFMRDGNLWKQEARLTANDTTVNDRLGSAVALSGQNLIAGAPGDDFPGKSDQGSAYAFRFNGSTWTQDGKMSWSNGEAVDLFGHAVAIDGDVAVIGAYFDDHGTSGDQGTAFVFRRLANGSWSRIEEITAADGLSGDWLGAAVAIDGATIIAGASGYGANDRGAAYVHTITGDWGFQQMIKGADAGANGGSNDEGGYSVAIDGDTAVIGAPGQRIGNSFNVGAVYIFTRVAGVWTQAKKLTAANGAQDDRFGESVGLDGGRLAVGAPGCDAPGKSDLGAVYVYNRAGGAWNLDEKLTPAYTAAGAGAGHAVAVRGNEVVAGAWMDDKSGLLDVGSITVFSKGGAGWNSAYIQPGDGFLWSRFGSSLAISSDRLIVGAPGDTLGKGAAYVYKSNPGDWIFTMEKKLTASDGVTGDQFGCAVGLDDNRVIVGAQFADTLNTNEMGAAYLYRRSGATWPFEQKITGDNPNAPGAHFGHAVAISGRRVLVGLAPSGTGECREFRYDGASWNKEQVLDDLVSLKFGRDGFAVAISGETAIYGNPDTGGNEGAGFIFDCLACPAITVNPGALPTATLGVAYNQTITASPAGTHSFSLSDGALPPGMTLTATGFLQGTPSRFGIYSFEITATSSKMCFGRKTYSLTVGGACPAYTLTPATLPVAMTGVNYSQKLTPTGGFGPWTFGIVGNWGPGLSFNQQTGELAGVPTTPGTYSFKVQATDGNNCKSAVQQFSLTVSSGNGGGGVAGLQYYPLSTPIRLLDTRAGQPGCDAPGAPIGAGTARTQTAAGRTCGGVTIPASAKALTGNITTVQSGGGYLTLYPSDAAKPLSANSNYNANEVLNNVFTTGLGAVDGAFKIFVTSNTDVVVDITGYYAAPGVGGLYFHPLPKPARLLDTRAGQTACVTPGAKLQAGSNTPLDSQGNCIGIPAGTKAIVGNATTVGPEAAGYLTLYPAGVAQPLAASSNFTAGQTMNGPFITGLSAVGELKIFTSATTDLIIDVLGYYNDQPNDAVGQGLLYTSLAAPVRLLDTRAGQPACYQPGLALAAGSTRNQQARGNCGNATIAMNAMAIVGNATVVNASAGYLTFWPGGVAKPLVATTNFNTGQVLNRHFTTGLSAAGIFDIYASAQTDLVIDVAGYFAP